MTNKETASLLREYNKWRRGKGRKYSQPGMLLDVKLIGEAIDRAVVCLSRQIDERLFCTLVGAANATFNRMKKVRKDVKEQDHADFYRQYADVRDAVYAAKKIVASINRRAKAEACQ